MNNGRSDLVDVECTIVGETDKAYRIDAGGERPVWVPKSMCEWDAGDGTIGRLFGISSAHVSILKRRKAWDHI